MLSPKLSPQDDREAQEKEFILSFVFILELVLGIYIFSFL